MRLEAFHQHIAWNVKDCVRHKAKRETLRIYVVSSFIKLATSPNIINQLYKLATIVIKEYKYDLSGTSYCPYTST